MSDPLSSLAENILKDLARDHGLSDLKADENGLVEVTLDENITVALAFGGDLCVMTSVVSETSEKALADPWMVFDAPEDWADRRTRLAVEPETNALMLIRDLLLEGVSYGAFAEAFAAFVTDVEAARSLAGDGGRSAAPGGTAAPEFAATSEEQMIFRP